MASQTTITQHDLILDRIPALPEDAPQTREQIADVATIIAEQFRPERIVLFGSYAYGVPNCDSDVDLLVVMDTPGRPVEQAVRIRQAVGVHHRFAMDILVRTPAQIRLGLEEGDFFIEDMMTQGATLFEAGDAGLVGQG